MNEQRKSLLKKNGVESIEKKFDYILLHKTAPEVIDFKDTLRRPISAQVM